MARKIEVEIIGDTSGLEKSFSKASVSTKGLFGTLAKGTLVVAGVQKAVDLTTEAVKIGWDEWTEANKISAQTNAVLKSTGNAANVTAKDVDTLATSIMKKSGMDDEAIASGENLLLTFTNIRNETGKGNDIFNQTTAIMADMSTALGQDTKSSALQLGKALNDPIKGVTALQRVGVSFTQGQKDQIKTLVASGKTMDAQKLILRELNKEFGGSAEAAGKTLPGQINIAKQTMSNFAGELVGKVIPVLENVVSTVKDHWPEIQKTLKQVWASVQPILASLKDVLLGVAEIVQENWPTISKIINQVWSVAKPILAALSDALKLLADLLRGDFSKAWDDVKSLVLNVLKAVENALTAEVTIIYTIAKTVGGKIVEGIMDGLDALGGQISNFLSDVGKWGAEIGTTLKNAAVNAILGIGSAAWQNINNINEWIENKIDAIIGWGARIGNRIKDAAVNAIVGIGGAVWDKIGNIADFIEKKLDTVAGWGAKIGTAFVGGI